MGMFYVMAGCNHFISPEWYALIVPPFLPYKYLIVYISGVFEIMLGILLVFSKTRQFAALGLILFLIAVFPSNIYLAITNGKALEVSSFLAWARLPVQFIFIGIAYWHSKVN